LKWLIRRDKSRYSAENMTTVIVECWTASHRPWKAPLKNWQKNVYWLANALGDHLVRVFTLQPPVWIMGINIIAKPLDAYSVRTSVAMI
jgi:hypothetical protein